ncbi:MAG: exonuclease SbcCD subunit D [Anaerovorax sp.]
MKLLHISDLHIGKRVHEFSMMKDQAYILEGILKTVEVEKPQVVLVAGDIYDKSVPSGEAVDLFDEFLTKLSQKNCTIMMVSGNHDSPERLNFGSRIMRSQNIHIAGSFSGELRKERVEDAYGTVNFYLLPFVKPAMIKGYFEDRTMETYEEGVEAILDSAEIDYSQRNVLVAHQFVTSMGKEPVRSESESISIGGLDAMDCRLFQQFDYVALGHIHRPQRIGEAYIRYSGSPLKYSFSEVNHKKSMIMVTLEGVKDQGQMHRTVTQVPLVPLHDLREIKGPIMELLRPEVYTLGNRLDYIWATLTDEEVLVDPMEKLRKVYPNLMKLTFQRDADLQKKEGASLTVEELIERNPLTLFQDFFEEQNGRKMTAAQEKIVKDVVNQYETR